MLNHLINDIVVAICHLIVLDFLLNDLDLKFEYVVHENHHLDLNLHLMRLMVDELLNVVVDIVQMNLLIKKNQHLNQRIHVFFHIEIFLSGRKKHFFIRKKTTEQNFVTRLVGIINDGESLYELRRLFVKELFLFFFLERAPKIG